jgi:hypothetical protein
MKKILLIAVGALLVLSGQAYGNLLTNPGLETGADNQTADGWTTVESTDPNGLVVDSLLFQTAPWASHSGERGAWFRAFLGSQPDATVDATLFQEVPVNEGEEYALFAWWRVETFWGGLFSSDFETYLTLDFLDAGDTVVGGGQLNIDTVHPGDGAWYQYSVFATAPAGTVKARVSASMVNGFNTQSNPQSAMVDDFMLVPEPTSILLLLPALALLRRR